MCVGGGSSGTVQRSSCDEIRSLVLGFLLLFSAAGKRLPTTTFSSFLVFFSSSFVEQSYFLSSPL